MENVVKQLSYLKPMIAVSALATIVVTMVFLVVLKKFSFQEKTLKLMGFFYDMKVLDSVAIAVTLMKFYLIISLAFMKGKVEIVHITCYGILIIAFNIYIHKLKESFVSIFNGAVVMAVLFITKFLVAYLTTVLFDIRILLALILLAIFLLMYSVYDICCCISAIIDKRSKLGVKNEKK